MTSHEPTSRLSLGIWIYVMSDALLFAALFATYAVLHTATASGPAPAQIFERPLALWETLALLTSSFTCGLALVAARSKKRALVWAALIATLLLGGLFLGLELHEFRTLIANGYGPDVSAFLSSFFTLVGTHGLHVFAGLLWLMTLLAHLTVRGLTSSTERGIFYFSLFWHFLDIIWICIFSLVYLFGTL